MASSVRCWKISSRASSRRRSMLGWQPSAKSPRAKIAVLRMANSSRRASGVGRAVLGALLAVLALFSLLDPGHADDLLVLAVERDEPHALRRPADHADLTDGHPNQDSGVGDEHHLVVVPHLADASDLAVALGGADGDEALAAAALESVLGFEGALAVAVLRYGEDGRARLHDVGGDHAVTLLERDAAHAARVAAHGADVRLGEADCHAI